MSYPSETKETIKEKDDPEAREALRKAFEKTWRWPEGFKGFSATLDVQEEGGTVSGGIEVNEAGKVQVAFGSSVPGSWLQGQLEMMIVHRQYRTFDQSDGKHILTKGEEDSHPLGRIIRIHGDGMNSYYRLRNGRIAQINRKNPRVQFTIQVEESTPTEDGRQLTTRHTVFYFVPGKGDLKTVQCFSDQHVLVDGIYLPGVRSFTQNEGGSVVSRLLKFRDHKLL